MVDIISWNENSKVSKTCETLLSKKKKEKLGKKNCEGPTLHFERNLNNETLEEKKRVSMI